MIQYLTLDSCRTWVAHPALAKIASDIFNEHMPTPNQLFIRREDVKISARDLLNMNVPGSITEGGIQKNLAIGLGYMEAWIRGIGCVPINYLMYVYETQHIRHPPPLPRLALPEYIPHLAERSLHFFLCESFGGK